MYNVFVLWLMFLTSLNNRGLSPGYVKRGNYFPLLQNRELDRELFPSFSEGTDLSKTQVICQKQISTIWFGLKLYLVLINIGKYYSLEKKTDKHHSHKWPAL